MRRASPRPPTRCSFAFARWWTPRSSPARRRRGSCVDVSMSVLPERPGQIVELQRRTRQGWRLIERLTLDPASQALASPCFTSDDVGVVRLRVRWVAQDTLNETGTSPVLAFEVSKARWMLEIDHAIGTRRVSVAVGEDDTFLYDRAASTPRIPASNEKLLLSMTLYDTLGSDFRIRTSVASSGGSSGAVRNLWILGQGDPGVTAATIGTLARRVADAGIERVRGRVFGSTGLLPTRLGRAGLERRGARLREPPDRARVRTQRPSRPRAGSGGDAHPQARGARRPCAGQAREREAAGRARDDRVRHARGRCSGCSPRCSGPRTTSSPRRSASGSASRRAACPGRSRRAPPRSRRGRTLTGRGSR